MTRSTALSQWAATVSTQLPHLSAPVASVLALWSFGLVMTQSCGLTTVAGFLAELLGQRENTVRQRLREWCWDAADKRGAQRRQLAVADSFGPLLRWVLRYWPADEKRLALAMDATTLGQLFTVLCISVVCRGCAVPVAWAIVPATAKGAWRPHWLALFQHLQGSLSAEWHVLVLADRGLYAAWLYQQIVQLGWHPYLRINPNGKFRQPDQAAWQPLSLLAPRLGSFWCGPVLCFKTQALACTLLVCWPAGQREPWLIVSDLAPAQANVGWYGLRSWIECGFKDIKRGGWQWQQTRMTDPARAGRLWLAIAVATLWVVSVGNAAASARPASQAEALPENHVARRRPSQRSRPRLFSCFRRGMLVIRAAFIAGAPQFCRRFQPEPWPTIRPPDTNDSAGPALPAPVD